MEEDHSSCRRTRRLRLVAEHAVHELLDIDAACVRPPSIFVATRDAGLEGWDRQDRSVRLTSLHAFLQRSKIYHNTIFIKITGMFARRRQSELCHEEAEEQYAGLPHLSQSPGTDPAGNRRFLRSRLRALGGCRRPTFFWKLSALAVLARRSTY